MFQKHDRKISAPSIAPATHKPCFPSRRTTRLLPLTAPPLYLIVEDRTKTVKIGVQCEPDTDDGKHFRVVVVATDAPDQDVGQVVKIQTRREIPSS